MAEQAAQTAKDQKDQKDQKEQKTQAPALTITEAGFSMNVRMIDEYGQEVMLTFRCPLASQSDKLIEIYKSQIDRLIKASWQPIKAGARPAANSGGGSAAPKCPIHGATMKESNKKAGMFFCPRKNADQSYCNQKVEEGQG